MNLAPSGNSPLKEFDVKRKLKANDHVLIADVRPIIVGMSGVSEI